MVTSIHVSYMNPTVELNETRRLLEITQVENQQKSQLIIDLNNQISQMQQSIDVEFKVRYLTKYIDVIIEIAKMKHKLLFEDIELLIQNNSRFSNNHNTNILSKEKFFKTAVTIDLIYGACHGRYVSEVHLAISAINSDSYSRFQKWLENLSKHEKPLPEDLLFLTFDNEQ
ncbi:2285_t:CDS:2 [Diversispora eburnea]|uniref:2285_t:CDS:1 n=1 Tax=Diversispora eburnea TaxID=1213867 RepID=A0A9N8VYY3_9GLOM|nr:2285_t:CDS:2 [Diversispora eburnea]